MRIVTIKDPWAFAIMRLGKDVENRRTNIAGGYRGPVAIHVAATPMKIADYYEAARHIVQRSGVMPIASLPSGQGVIIGVVDLTDVHPVANPHFHPICHDLTEPNGLGAAAARGDSACSQWAHPEGRWHLVLENPRPLAEPIPFRGALGLRKLDDDMVARIEAAIA